MPCNLNCLNCDLSRFSGCNLSCLRRNLNRGDDDTGASGRSERTRSTKFVHTIWLSIVAWIFSVVAVADCTFIRVGLGSVSYSALREVGLFQYNLASDEHQCVSFSNTVNFSAAVKTARAFGVISCLLTSFVMLQVLSLVFFLQQRRDLVWKVTCIQVVLAPIAQVLTFTAFGDDDCTADGFKCAPGAAGIIAIVNIFILIALAVVCWFTAPPMQPLYEIKRLDATTSSPEEKPTTAEDVESDGVDYVDTHPEQAVPNSDFEEDELDNVVKSVGADAEYPVKSVRPISPDSEKKRHSFRPTPPMSPRSSKTNEQDFGDSRLEV